MENFPEFAVGPEHLALAIGENNALRGFFKEPLEEDVGDSGVPQGVFGAGGVWGQTSGEETGWRKKRNFAAGHAAAPPLVPKVVFLQR